MPERRPPVTPILAIETSCDETAAAVVEDGRIVKSSVVSSQVDLHARFGGVVPEVAGRAHVDLLTPGRRRGHGPGRCHRRAISTPWPPPSGPGLIGSLLVGVSAAKAYALAWGVPFVGVNHLEGHLHAAFLEDPDLALPAVVLLVSGGHTMLDPHAGARAATACSGQTIDDAAGEAFDKVARFLGLGYPGGPAIEQAGGRRRSRGDRVPAGPAPRGVRFLLQRPEDRVITYVRKHPEVATADVAASFQEAVVDVLVEKTRRAAAARRGPVGLPRWRGGRQLGAAGADRQRRPRGRACGLRPEPGDVHGQRRHGRGHRPGTGCDVDGPTPARRRRPTPTCGSRWRPETEYRG